MSIKFLTDGDRLEFLLGYISILPPGELVVPCVVVKANELEEDLTWGPMNSTARANQCHLGDIRTIIDRTIRKREQLEP